MTLNEVNAERRATNETAGVSKPVAFLAWFAVLAARIVALASILFGLISALGLLVIRGIDESDSGSVFGYLIYLVVNALLAWGIFKARPMSSGPAGKLGSATPFMFVVLLMVIGFMNLITVGLLVIKSFDFGNVIYGLMTLLLAGGIARTKSVTSLSALVLLAALAFIPLMAGLPNSNYEGTPRSDGPGGAALARLVTDLRKEHKLVGLAAMVMVDGKVISTAADGERKRGSGMPIELGDRWHLGSITKSVTATMIARLVESGQMSWTDTVGESFADASIHEDWKPVTLEQLLTHTSGAPANFSYGVRRKKPALGPECTRERRQAVLDVMAEKPAHPPGEQFAYSNVGYTIAGAMAESTTGVSWEELVKREVFAPLELSETGFGPPKSPPETLDQPRGHRGLDVWKTSVNDDVDNTPIIGPAGTLHMTLGNLCKYAAEHLRGELGAGKLLTAETYKRLHTPRLRNYACGWVVKRPTDEIPGTVYWHNGSNTLWYALVVFIPDKNMVVAVAANDGDVEAAESAAWEIVDASAASSR